MTFLAHIWRLLDGTQRRWALIAQAASLLMACCTVVGIASISRFFALLGDPRLIAQSRMLMYLRGCFGRYDDGDFLVLLGIGFAGMVVATSLLNWAGFYAMQRVALKIGDDMQGMLFREYLHRGILYHARAHSATLCSHVAYETERGVVTTLESTFVLITSLVTAVLVIAAVLFVNAPASVAMVGVLVAGYGIIYLSLRGRIYRAGHAGSTLAAARTKLILETFGAVKEITVARRQEFFEKRFEESSRGLSRRIAYLDALTSTPRYLMESIAVCGLVGIALAMRERGVGHWLAQLTFLALALYRLLPALQQAFASVVRIRAAGASFAVIAEDLRRARLRCVEAPAVQRCAEEPPIRSIELANVCFRYGLASRPAVDDVSLDIIPGTIVGLIGTNGSGKTTLLDILAGLLVPDAGCVLVDGVPLQGDALERWQSRLAYVPQSTFLLDLSIAENIALGVEPERIDQTRLRTAARLARLDDVVAALPSGYQEIIGERGARLSGGQRQRLGIARALYSNASVLLMDESTNALDERVEAEVMAVIEGLRGVRTIVMVTHRSSTLQRCDRIYELHRGRIVTAGGRMADNYESSSRTRISRRS